MSEQLEQIERFFKGTSIETVYAWRDEIEQRLKLADKYINDRECETGHKVDAVPFAVGDHVRIKDGVYKYGALGVIYRVTRIKRDKYVEVVSVAGYPGATHVHSIYAASILERTVCPECNGSGETMRVTSGRDGMPIYIREECTECECKYDPQ